MEVLDSNLMGTLPECFSHFTKLTKLNVFGNRLHGTIPYGWSALSNMRSLRLSVFDPFAKTKHRNAISGTDSSLPVFSHGSLYDLRL